MGCFCCVWIENCRWKCGSLNFFPIKFWSNHTFMYPSVFKCLTTLIWNMWSISTMCHVNWPGLFLINLLIWSSSITSSLLEYSQSSRSKFPLLNSILSYGTISIKGTYHFLLFLLLLFFSFLEISIKWQKCITFSSLL